MNLIIHFPGVFFRQGKTFFINGWKLQRGPCENCTEKDEGSEVTARRKQYLNDTNDPEAFGKWLNWNYKVLK